MLKGQNQAPSALGTLLLTMWNHRHMSAKGMQEIAHMAILDGATHPELAQIASAGLWGEIPGNVHRDVMAHYCQDISISPAIHVQVPVLEPKSSKVLVEDASIFLPHILFSDLAHHYPDQFHNLFGTQDLQPFWTGVEKVKDDRLYQHPICLDERQGEYTKSVQNKQKTIPIFMHCDGVEFQSRDSLQVWNWGGLLNQYHSLASHFLVSAIPKACTTEDTWDPIMAWVTWSLEALLKGYHPEVGPDNEPLLKGSPFHALKGLPLTLEITGQWYGQCRGTMKCTPTPSTSPTGMQPAHAGTVTASSHSVKAPLVQRGKASNSSQKQSRGLYMWTPRQPCSKAKPSILCFQCQG